MIPARRLEMNRGYGDSSGKWVFDDILFEDSLIGKACVSYDFHVSRDTDRGVFDPLLDSVIANPRVDSICVFDDNGEELPVPDSVLSQMVAVVLELFASIENEVREYELTRMA